MYIFGYVLKLTGIEKLFECNNLDPIVWSGIGSCSNKVECNNNCSCGFRCGSIDSIYGPVRNPWKYRFRSQQSKSQSTADTVKSSYKAQVTVLLHM